MAMMQGDASPGNAGTTTSSTTTSSGTSSPTSSDTATTDTATETATDTEAADAEAAAVQAVADCADRTRLGDALAKAAAASAKSWSAHAGAQVSLDAGKISYARAGEIWADSKKNAAAELSGFKTASSAYSESDRGCEDVEAQTAGSSVESQGADCAARDRAQAKVAKTGKAVNDQWAAHVAQMKTKATSAGPAYHDKWMDFVSDSKPVLAAYDSAAKALAKAPACSA